MFGHTLFLWGYSFEIIPRIFIWNDSFSSIKPKRNVFPVAIDDASADFLYKHLGVG
ncbi:hypothetical protein TFUB4_00025 [Tannerella forsythia]|uniref:Uncharacterized protein n=1 Tax=Tannerella forsythia TaxID=28112 RepID=A0A1D3UBD6_TANFO|nr:hypothetical protein TFUB22_00027 [Tannerella forsythia]SCQ17454.1 hypothetical protein TFUB4_00025 [Tannerella forsythia]SCQ17490.1 hypothetical protein TFUB20_00025 [Tannerella forsythia]